VLLLVVEVLDVLSALLLVNDLLHALALIDRVDFCLELDNLVGLLLAASLVLLNPVVEVSFAIFGLNLLAHGESGRALVERLVGRDRHLDLVSNSEQEQAALRLAQADLANDLIKAL